MKIFFSILLLSLSLSAKNHISPNDVYSQSVLIDEEIIFLLKYYNIEHAHDNKTIVKNIMLTSQTKPRNSWQKTYEIMVKINLLRNKYKLAMIEPVNIEAVLNMSSELVYEQTQRVLTELQIFKTRMNIKSPKFQLKTFKGKTSADVFYLLSHISDALDELNQGVFTPSNVFAENIRLYDDLTTILQHLNIEDKTIPYKINQDSTPTDTFNIAKQMLEIIKQLHIKAGIDFVDFSEFKTDKATSSDVFALTQMIIAELQPIKAYIGLSDYVTPSAHKYYGKTSVEVNQLMSWCLRKLKLITNLEERRE